MKVFDVVAKKIRIQIRENGRFRDMNKSSYSFDWLLVLGVISAIGGLLQFGIRLPIAMSVYAGGSRDAPAEAAYSYSKNWLSDLGRQVAWNGKDNFEAASIFNGSVACLCFSCLAFARLKTRAWLRY